MRDSNEFGREERKNEGTRARQQGNEECAMNLSAKISNMNLMTFRERLLGHGFLFSYSMHKTEFRIGVRIQVGRCCAS